MTFFPDTFFLKLRVGMQETFIFSFFDLGSILRF